jgi:cysteinyl-tRNA synthetase
MPVCVSIFFPLFLYKNTIKIPLKNVFLPYKKCEMEQELYIYNSLTRKKEKFEAISPPFVGMYVCGPTVYGDAHLGHARPAISFDLVYRYLEHIGYKVRYVRNITDVGHLENDADEGEDKIAKKARLENLEPMEIAQYYSNRYRDNMRQLNVKEPSIEPLASGHIIEQIEMVKKIMDAGFAYEVDGNIYFDVVKYNENHHYGILSGRKIEEMLNTTRDNLQGQEEKRNPVDFALWKKASKNHIMRWPSPWSDGFPGWHMECSAMGAKYLGEEFDIHGGGMDLRFPHHEAEIAQSMAANNKQAVKYWMHNNMITINGQKMGKSLNNFITLDAFFKGDHPLLERGYTPMTIRFFILQAHYRSTLDFSNEALTAAEKGLTRLSDAAKKLSQIQAGKAENTVGFDAIIARVYAAMNDDLNSPIAIAALFDAVKIINKIAEGKLVVGKEELERFTKFYPDFIQNILGLLETETTTVQDDKSLDKLMELIMAIRQQVRKNKDFETSDKIRDALQELNIVIKDTPDGSVWEKK